MSRWEVKNYPLEEASIGVFKARRLMRCPWADRYTEASDILDPTSSDFIYPYTSFTTALARKVRIRPYPEGRISEGDTSEQASYSQALLDVFYSTLGPALWNNTTLLHEEFHPRMKDGPASVKGLVWDVGDDAVPVKHKEAATRLNASAIYLLQYPRETAIPAAVLTHFGSVNAAAVTAYWLGLTFPAETLLYLGADIIHNVGTDGSRTYDIRHQFLYKANDNGEGPLGWNWFWRELTQQYEQLRTPDGNTLDRYPPKDFAF
jgi:hypothetical protein